MYIPYEKISKKLTTILPNFLSKFVEELFNELKIQQNEHFILQNHKKVILKLREKIKSKEKINVIFYVYDETKWKNQSLYDLFEKEEIFIPHIYVTKNTAPTNNANHQTKSDIEKVYSFFKNKGMRVSYAYDFEKDCHISFDKMDTIPDIIIYSHPWYVHTTQGPVLTSKYAINYYIPYFIANSTCEIEYYLRFHRYIQNYCVLNSHLAEDYKQKMKNSGKNLLVVGHPILDFFYLNKNKLYEKKDYVIYAPHWTIDKNTTLKFGNFLWAGKFMLEWAKSHPEIKWVFKPHPCLKEYLKINKYMSEEDIDKYWSEWSRIGEVNETGNYLDLFMSSKAMITDCGSFLTEYFFTHMPVIHLRNSEAFPFNTTVSKITNAYYQATNTNDLEKYLEQILILNKDSLEKKRRKIFEELDLGNTYAAMNILNDIKKELKINE